jgi:hypothetical protein
MLHCTGDVKDERVPMKKAILGVTLAVLAAGPAMAQATPMLWQTDQAYRSRAAYQGLGAYNAAPRAAYAHEYRFGNNVVIDGNRVVGQDPDPNVRLELRRDPVSEY